MSTLHEALRLADDRPSSVNDDLYQWAIDAEDELRRQHAEVAALREALKEISAASPKADHKKLARAALAEPQEPFGWVTVRRLSQRFENHADQYQFYPAGQAPYLDNVDECHTVYTHPAPQRQPQDEPVAKVELMTTGGNAGLATRIVEIDDHLRERLRPGQMLYTHPAQQRQRLSGHEIRRIVDETVKDVTADEHVVFHEVVRAIERAHGIGGQDE